MSKPFKGFLCDLIICVGLIVGAYVLYIKTLSFELTYLDDNVWLLDYQWYFKKWSNALGFFTRPDFISGMFYRPLLNISFLVNAQLGGIKPYGYHFTNIFIHGLSASLVYCILKVLKGNWKIALSFSCIFLVHPVLTTSVAWIPGRTDSLLGLFSFASFYCFLLFIPQQKKVFFLWHLIFAIFACMIKETAIVLPVLCCVYLFLVEETPIKKSIDFLLKYKWLVVLWVACIGGWFCWRAVILSEATKVNGVYAITSMFKNTPAIISYVGKLFFPVNLSVLPVLEDLHLAYGVCSGLLLIGFIFFSSKARASNIFFGFLWFFLFILPSLVISFLCHEYRLYVPILGIMIVITETGAFRWLVRHEKLFIGLSVLVIAIFASTNWQYQNRFSNRFDFWESAVRTSPHAPLAHRNLGAMYHLEGRLDEAEAEYRKTIALNPNEAMVHNNLGLIYMSKGQHKKAEKEFTIDYKIFPDHEKAYYNLGQLYATQGKMKEAAKYWEKTIEVNPKYIDAYKRLTLYYYKEKAFKKSDYYRQQLRQRGISMPNGFEEALDKELKANIY